MCFEDYAQVILDPIPLKHPKGRNLKLKVFNNEMKMLLVLFFFSISSLSSITRLADEGNKL